MIASTVVLLAALAAPPGLTSSPAVTGGSCADAPPLATDREKTLYAVGASAAESFKVFQLTPEELAIVERGLSDAVLGKPLEVNLGEYRSKVNELAAEGYAKQSRALLTKYAARKGAVTTASGLVYLPEKEGSGASPSATDTVKVQYEGRLPDGTVFDSSRRRNEPSTFPLDKVIKCWTEGVQRMKVGGRATLVCPVDLAYGPAGKPPTIPPNSALAFDVELLGIVAK